VKITFFSGRKLAEKENWQKILEEGIKVATLLLKALIFGVMQCFICWFIEYLLL